MYVSADIVRIMRGGCPTRLEVAEAGSLSDQRLGIDLARTRTGTRADAWNCAPRSYVAWPLFHSLDRRR